MTPKEIYKFIIEQSPEPLIKNPVLRNVVDQERLGFYLGKKVPSEGTIEDADVRKAEDALSGSTDVMKVADLQRQGHIGHYYADGGEVIGKPGGVVDPGITYYGVRKTRSGTEISDEKTRKFKYPYKNQHGTFYRAEPKGVSTPTAEQIEVAEKVHGKKKQYRGKKGINLWRALNRSERSNIIEKHVTGGTMGVPGGKLKKNMLSKEAFTNLVNANTDKTVDEFVEVLKEYRTKDGKKFKYQTVVDRVRDYGLTGKLKSKNRAPYTKKEVFALSTEQSLKDYKKGKIDYERLKLRAIDRAGAQNRSEGAKEKRRKRQKIYRTKLLKTEEGRERIKAQSRKQKAKEYLIEGLDPPATTAEQAIWKDAVTTAKKNKDGKGRFSFDSGYSKSMKGKDFYAGKIKIRDNQTGKTFSFNTFKNYINNNAESFGIEGYRDAMKPYRQKYFINEIPNLRNNLNAALIPGWKGGDKRTAITIQHDFGRQNNPLKASIAFYDANEQEYKVKDKFERAWAQNVGEDGKIKVTPEIKKAYKEYTSDIAEKNIISKPSMVKRDRTFGRGLDLTETLKIAKERGATIPQGAFKKAKEYENLLVRLCPKKAEGGRIGFALGSGAKCGGRRLEQILLRGTTNKDEQMLANAILKGGRELMSVRNLLGPAALAAGVAFEAGLVGFDMLNEGRTFREAIGNSLFNYALGDKTKIDPKEERYKRYKASGIGEDEIGKIALFESNIDRITEIGEQFAKPDLALYQAGAAINNPRVSPVTRDKLINNYLDAVDETAAFNQDLFRTGEAQFLDTFDYGAGQKALEDADRESEYQRLLKKQDSPFTKYFRGDRSKQTLKEQIEGLKQGLAGGGIAGIRRPSAIPPQSGPLPDGLPGVLKRVKNI